MTAPADASWESILSQFWLTLALVGIPGVLGGLTNGISIFLRPENEDGGKSPSGETLPKRSYYLAYAVTGLGGSLAALLVILWAQRFPKGAFSLEDLLTLTCTGFVAGYIANKLLPAIANSFYKKLTDLSEQQAELAKKSEQGIGNAVSLSTELTRAKDYLASGSFVAGQTEKLIASLSSLVKTYPTNRPLNILLSRTWDEASKNRRKALDVLEAFIKAKLDAQEKDEDLAAAYWNCANYFEADFKETNQPIARTQAIEALRKTLECSPSYLNQLLKDEDFAKLRAAAVGKRLLEDFGHQHGA